MLLPQLQNREVYHELSLKYLLTAIPQLLAALLLLLDCVCTFSRASSTFAYGTMVDSCLHEGIAGLMLVSILFSTFHLALSVCCSFPAFCPVDPIRCQLSRIVACPGSVANLPHYNLYPRLAHTCATFTMLFALCIKPAHIFKDQHPRVRRKIINSCCSTTTRLLLAHSPYLPVGDPVQLLVFNRFSSLRTC
ncbi:hypothetical protein PHYSODRAFT_514357 [Phytophthora sojae]|uniref:Uncharacterized protein n=1 Tax=Phytophthora sojae (strain P6497) TaxID=1094619 RepID=G4ZVD3_PHYSP|nr:hypothetical protein PHYSODRAFT_514357 [Phytophthora sojae]EGZ13757.1 hypothetical protein PHYSODRAFT_514357 [Phytophthora sojae]|eukprot:XP_009531186.1 hypothetical protein PHYSODRAFT_514357 [Phytophthora sojae]